MNHSQPIQLAQPAQMDEHLHRPVILIDTREKRPYCFNPNFKVKRVALETGDYSLEGLGRTLCIERKSPADFLNSITQERERFFNEINRMRAFSFKYLLIECNWHDIYSCDAFTILREAKQVSHSSVLGTIACIQCDYGIPVIFAGERPYAKAWIETMLTRYWETYVKSSSQTIK